MNAQTKAIEAKASEAKASATYGIEALCEATGANAKDVRRFIRRSLEQAGAKDAAPGKGGRYAFTAAQVEALAKRFNEAKARKGSAAAANALEAFFKS